MNPYVIRESLKTHKGERVQVKVYGLRNKKDTFIGVLKELYPKIFVIEVGTTLKTFSYSELISKEVVLTFI